MGVQIARIYPQDSGFPWIAEVTLKGKLTTRDYESFVPEIEKIMRRGKVRILLQLEDFHGWTTGALWEDTKFAIHHFQDIGRIAIVGDKMWEKAMAIFCRPFTSAKVEYFDSDRMQQAREWIWEGKKVPEQTASAV